MMRLAQGLAALAGLSLLPFSAFADEPPPGAAGPVRSGRVVVEREVEVRYLNPNLVPDCWDQSGAVLLKCAPRAYVVPQDVATLNQLNAVPSRVVRPYPYLFSW
jgi:hypothetical protein